MSASASWVCSPSRRPTCPGCCWVSQSSCAAALWWTCAAWWQVRCPMRPSTRPFPCGPQDCCKAAVAVLCVLVTLHGHSPAHSCPDRGALNLTAPQYASCRPLGCQASLHSYGQDWTGPDPRSSTSRPLGGGLHQAVPQAWGAALTYMGWPRRTLLLLPGGCVPQAVGQAATAHAAAAAHALPRQRDQAPGTH